MISSIPKWVSNLFGNTMRPNVKVLETIYISSQIKKIRFQGNISNWSFEIGYASVIRVSETEFRNYTIAYHDKKSSFFDIIFHIHNYGVGSNYIDTLKADDELFVSQPRGIKQYNSTVKQQFVIGDETSLGFAFAFMPILKANKNLFQFYFELDETNKDVPALLGLENYLVFPKNNSFRNENWVNNLPIYENSEWEKANFILIGNVKSAQTFRKVIKNRVNTKTYLQGFWLQGKKGL